MNGLSECTTYLDKFAKKKKKKWWWGKLRVNRKERRGRGWGDRVKGPPALKKASWTRA